MDNYYIIGVVVSKNKLAFCLTFQDKILKQGDIKNELASIKLSISLLLQEFQVSNEQVLICAEHAGQYNYPLIYTCESEKYKLWLENPYRMKFFCSGMNQGKNYKLNAKQIAVYAYRNGDKLNMYQQPNSEVEHLKQLYNELNMLEINSEKLHSKLVDQRNYMSEEVFNGNARRHLILIQVLEDAIATIDNEIKYIFTENNFLAQQMELLTSIEGVDWNIALKMIVETDGFTRFENYRQFCSHVGIAPVNATLKSIQQIHLNINLKLDRGIKTLLNMATLSVIKKDDCELKNYYNRKVSEGKDEKIVINAVRIKLVARMFAVIKSNHKYQPIYPMV